MSKKQERGTAFILEGGDANGKSTQAKRLAKHLDCKEFHFPYYECMTGQVVRRMIADKKEGATELEFQRAVCANFTWFYNKVVLPIIETGENVVITRGILSAIAYGRYAAKDQNEFEHIYDLVLALELFLHRKKIKTVNIILDLPVEEAMKRIKRRDDEAAEIFENEKCLTSVRKTYLETQDIPIIKCEGKTKATIGKEVNAIVKTYFDELDD